MRPGEARTLRLRRASRVWRAGSSTSASTPARSPSPDSSSPARRSATPTPSTSTPTCRSPRRGSAAWTCRPRSTSRGGLPGTPPARWRSSFPRRWDARAPSLPAPVCAGSPSSAPTRRRVLRFLIPCAAGRGRSSTRRTLTAWTATTTTRSGGWLRADASARWRRTGARTCSSQGSGATSACAAPTARTRSIRPGRRTPAACSSAPGSTTPATDSPPS